MYVIDLFSGAGGLSEGFVEAGFDIIAHVDKDYWACETLKTRACFHWLLKNNYRDYYDYYLVNAAHFRNIKLARETIFYKKFPELKLIVERMILNRNFGHPLQESGTVSAEEVINDIKQIALDRKLQNIPLIIGGPPCQTYSLIGRGRMRKRVLADHRNYLFRFFLEIVHEFNPKLFVFENVPGLLNAHGGRLLEAIREEFDSIGYGLASGTSKDDRSNIVEANDFGVHQSRKRLIMFGYYKKSFPYGFIYPKLTSFAIEFNEPYSTYNAISDLPALNPGEGNDYWFGRYRRHEMLSSFQNLMRKNSIGISNHKARNHREEDLHIYSIAIEKASNGQQLYYSQLPPNLQFHENRNKKIFEDRFRVHCWNEIPHTIVAHIAKDGHYNIHPDIKQLRSLTVREAARIQSFPDNYRFEGPRTSQFNQVGNAVPPLLAGAIARSIKSSFSITCGK